MKSAAELNEDDQERDYERLRIREAEARQRKTGLRPPVAEPVSESIREVARLQYLEYGDYLKTSHWKALRKEVLLAAQSRCQVCYSPGPLHVHHRTYDRRGCEWLSDLIALCVVCHDLFHEFGKLCR